MAPMKLREVIPRLDRSLRVPDLDKSLPAVLLWVSRFPLQHSCLGVFRSLGRAGVPVFAVVADPEAPVAKSRYVSGLIPGRTDRGEGYAE